MARTTRKAVAVFGFATVLLAFAIAFLALRDAGPALPNPNGYDDFVKAGRMVTTALDGQGWLGDYPELDVEALRAFAATNAEALRIVRAALERPCRVPVQNSTDWFRTHLTELANLKQLTQVFMLTARLAQLEGRTNDALSLYLDSIRFAHECNRGGLVIHTAIDRTQEALGLQGLKAVESAMDATQYRRMAGLLEDLDSRQEPWGNYVRRNWRYTLRAETKTLFSLDGWRTHQSFRTRFYQSQLRRRQAMLTFAARAFELETGSKPASAAALAPAYLKAIPDDPISGRRLALPP